MNRDTLTTVAVVLLLLAGGIWFYLNFERVTEREEVGYQGEARRNPLLAAQRLFERMGVAARELRQPAELDALPAGATLFLARYRAGLAGQRVDTLLAWVDRGGHLIVEAEHFKNKDPLLDRLEIERIEIRNRAPRPPSAVALPHAPEVMRVHFGYGQKLLPRAAPAYRFDDISGTHLVHLTRGRGSVTAVPDLQFLNNREIAKHDHAEFAWQLVRFSPVSREVLLAPRLAMPTLLDWVLEHAVAAMALSAALLGAWLWHVMPRFGPLQPDPLPGRRRLLDHLRASGRFHWARGRAANLLQAAREACVRKIARSHPAIVDLPRVERAQRLAAMTQIDAGEIELALHGEAGEAAQFTGAIRVLQRIDDSLVRKNPELIAERP